MILSSFRWMTLLVVWKVGLKRLEREKSIPAQFLQTKMRKSCQLMQQTFKKLKQMTFSLLLHQHTTKLASVSVTHTPSRDPTVP